jgi:hypothetical protein
MNKSSSSAERLLDRSTNFPVAACGLLATKVWRLSEDWMKGKVAAASFCQSSPRIHELSAQAFSAAGYF